VFIKPFPSNVGGNRQQGDLISPTLFFQNKESGLKSWEIRQMIKVLFNDAVSSSDYVAPHGEMISESGVEWPLPGRTEEHHENPQSMWQVPRLRFESVISRVHDRSVNTLSNMLDR
jgi:hypothetical protein